MFIRHTLFSAAVLAATLVPSTIQAGYIGWPCSATVTSPYGPRSSPCSGCSTFHYGIDLGVASGTILGSPGDGTVTSYAYDSCAGNLMKIGYGGGWETRFLHTSSRIVSVGASVSRNTSVAKSGNTGSCTTGAHLHFEVRKDGVAQSIPGSSGTWVSKNVDIPKNYPGLNDTGVTYYDYTPDVSANWIQSSYAPDRLGSVYYYRAVEAISDAAVFEINTSGTGSYDIYAWWPAGTNRSNAAPIILPDNTTVYVNQQINGGQWNKIGTNQFNANGLHYVKVSCWTSAGDFVMADGVKLVGPN